MKTRLIQFVWHMHQPYYGLPDRGTSFLPWVRLHSVKSYYDMARMLERHPTIRGTVNFSGSLLKQLHEYVSEGRRDTWWELTLKSPDDLSDTDKRHLLKHFFSLDWDHCIRPRARFSELLDQRNEGHAITRFQAQDWMDLQVWFNLGWCGFSVRAESTLVQDLLARGRGFTQEDKVALLDLHIKVMQDLPDLYRSLAKSGQVEISVTPMYHPILPLIIDTDAAARATPDRPRPERFQAKSDAHHQVKAALEMSTKFFGVRPAGMWPAEGSISPEAVQVFAEEGVQWIASDEDVLRASRGSAWAHSDITHPWKLDTLDSPSIFFRDHSLSDQIGFVYSKNSPKHATLDFIARVRAVPSSQGPNVVSVILDGENAWEHYPDDGQGFLDALYTGLEGASDIKTTTPSQVLKDATPKVLHYLHSGSWILANYQIWIGHPEENRGWDLLGRTREVLLSHEASCPKEKVALAWEALYAAEGSDWFWWYGDDFDSENDADFDRLFRENLKCVYWFLGLESPADLDIPIIHTSAGPPTFTPPRGLISPRIDGRAEFFYEWTDAGYYINTGARGSMFETTRLFDRMLVGFDETNLYLRLIPGLDLKNGFVDCNVRFTLVSSGKVWTVNVSKDRAQLDGDPGPHDLRFALRHELELAIPLHDIGAGEGSEVLLQVVISRDGMELERHPPNARLTLKVPSTEFEGRNWMV